MTILARLGGTHRGHGRYHHWQAQGEARLGSSAPRGGPSLKAGRFPLETYITMPLIDLLPKYFYFSVPSFVFVCVWSVYQAIPDALICSYNFEVKHTSSKLIGTQQYRRK